ncbi:UNVERIFIED_CONTAM: hypothetical protein Slati_3946200 [Sesamum latifolium]|uniref:Uncharacterized protein n=1 Tax=Sesamum latifolium TaxID=2727402 RepID=A0AAW2TQ09_9LAMI
MGRIDLMIELEGGRPWRGETKRPTTRSPSRIQYTSHNVRPANGERMADLHKDYELFHSAKNGNFGYFGMVLSAISAAEQASSGDILRRASAAGNTYMHVAAKHGNADIVTYIGKEDASVLLYKNDDADTPLHLAAKLETS